MQKIIAALTAALGYVFSSKQQVAKLKEEVRERDNIINDLRTALDDEKADDASLEAASTAAKEAQAAAEQRYNDLVASISEAETKATELASSLTEDPEVPIEVDSNTGTVTHTDESSDTVSGGDDTIDGGDDTVSSGDDTLSGATGNDTVNTDV